MATQEGVGVPNGSEIERNGDEACYVEIDGVCALRETDRALLCDIHGRRVWIPFAQIAESSQVRSAGDTGSLLIPMWLAKSRGLCLD